MSKLKHTYSNCNQYAERDIEQLDDHYMVHIDAMTVEGLYSKSSIAAELAFRDARIVELEKELVNVRGILNSQEDKSCLGSGHHPDCAPWSVVEEVINSITQTLKANKL